MYKDLLPGHSVPPQLKQRLFDEYLKEQMGINDLRKEWGKQSIMRKAKIISLMFVFNFIILYKFFRS